MGNVGSFTGVRGQEHEIDRFLPSDTEGENTQNIRSALSVWCLNTLITSPYHISHVKYFYVCLHIVHYGLSYLFKFTKKKSLRNSFTCSSKIVLLHVDLEI